MRKFHEPGILVVDDEHVIRSMVQLALELNGFVVRSAADGREAIRMYQRHRDCIAVVLLDVSMPDPDGPATLHALRQLDPEVVVCFMGGVFGGYQREGLLRLGAVQVLDKPFCMEDLLQVLQPLARDAARGTAG